jgi:plastocyanin
MGLPVRRTVIEPQAGRLKCFACCIALFVGLAIVRVGAGDATFKLLGSVYAGNRPDDHAVVWLEAPNSPRPSLAKKRVLDQRNLKFRPRVLVVQVGTTVEFPNNDRVFHNVFSFHDGKRFDLGLYPVGTVKHVTFDNPGVSRIYCNIHPNMAAYVIAVDTPYFSTSDENGQFAIADVLPGTYTYHVWRPGREVTGSAAVEPGKPLEIRWP